MDKILVIGGGSWGTSFADYLCRSGNPVRLWVRETEVIESIRTKRENTLFLPDFRLSPRLTPVTDLESEAAEAGLIILAVPSKFSRGIYKRLNGIINDKPIVNLTKGIESSSMKTISQLAIEIFGNGIMDKWLTISGPSFARELALDHPTAVVAASKNRQMLEDVQHRFSTDILRIYRTDDLTGIEVSGSMKNIMAIASGIVNGSNYGYNTTASLVTRGSVEISRLGLKMGARKETFWGLAGIGDLMLTCFGPLSRNFQLGVQIAKGKTLEEIEKTTRTVAEGVETCLAVNKLSERLKIEMPITSQVHDVLFTGKKPKTALKELMTRSLKPE